MKWIVIVLALLLAQAAAEPPTLRGWLSDESCARARADSGTYTGTNPDCAKRCVSQGKKIVLIDPSARRVLAIENQEAARGNIGDEVEIAGSVDSNKNALHIDSIKLVAHGAAMCSRPKHAKN